VRPRSPAKRIERGALQRNDRRMAAGDPADLGTGTAGGPAGDGRRPSR
jgi:hypothetical protein